MKLFKIWVLLAPLWLVAQGAAAQALPAIAITERTLNPTCVATKAAVCTFASTLERYTFREAGPADGCAGFTGLKFQPAYTRADWSLDPTCLKGFRVNVSFSAGGTASMTLFAEGATNVGNQITDYIQRQFDSKVYEACHVAVTVSANMGTQMVVSPSITLPDGKPSSFDLQPSACAVPSTVAESLATDVRALREKFDTQLKAALEAAIQTKTAQPEKKN